MSSTPNHDATDDDFMTRQIATMAERLLADETGETIDVLLRAALYRGYVKAVIKLALHIAAERGAAKAAA